LVIRLLSDIWAGESGLSLWINIFSNHFKKNLMKSIITFFTLFCACILAQAQTNIINTRPLTINSKVLEDTISVGDSIHILCTITNNTQDTLMLKKADYHTSSYHTSPDFSGFTPSLPPFLLPKEVFTMRGAEKESGYKGNTKREIYIHARTKSQSPKAFVNDADAISGFSYYTKSLRYNKIEFAYSLIDRQDIPYGGDGYLVYPFKNTGNEPLIITNIRSSCGCLVPGYPKEPIMPNEWAMIYAIYNTKRTGTFTKTVTIWCNDKNQETVTLTVKGNVEMQKTGDTALLGNAILAPKSSSDTAKIKVELVKPLLKFYNTNFEKNRLSQNEPYTFYVVYEDATRAYETLSVLSQSPEISAVRFRKHVLKTSSWYHTHTEERLSIIEIDYNTQKIGAFDSNIVLKTSDPSTPSVRISLKGLILESENPVFIKK
jgi:Protein of unknown function (DUF1573)